MNNIGLTRRPTSVSLLSYSRTVAPMERRTALDRAEMVPKRPRTDARVRRASTRKPAAARQDARSATRRSTSRDRSYEPKSLLERAGAIAQWMGEHRAASIALIVTAILLLSLFGPVRSYYNSIREGEVLQQKYEEVTSINDEIRAQRDSYMTEEGIENAARELGYVYEGETSVSVEGVEDAVGSESTVETSYNDARDAKTKFLDFLFGFDPETTWNNA